jgi:hypothetical protein
MSSFIVILVSITSCFSVQLLISAVITITLRFIINIMTVLISRKIESMR